MSSSAISGSPGTGPSATALSGKAGENALKAATVQNTEPQLQAEPDKTANEAIADAATETKDKRGRKKVSHVEGDEDTDPVLLSRIVFESTRTRNSLSVKHMQRRLVELGFVEAGADKAGWYSTLTKSAVAEFQKKHDLDSTGIADAQTLKALFKGDKNVNLILD